LINEFKNVVQYTTEYSSAIKMIESCLWQNRVEDHYVNEVNQTQKDKYCMISFEQSI
jgi:hypothetical protein